MLLHCFNVMWIVFPGLCEQKDFREARITTGRILDLMERGCCVVRHTGTVGSFGEFYFESRDPEILTLP